MLKRRQMIEDAGLDWSVVESIAVAEDIKTRSGNFRESIDDYKGSIRAVARAGVKIICYNFMAITDWTRTDLDAAFRPAATRFASITPISRPTTCSS